MSNLERIYGSSGSLPEPSRRSARQISRGLARYENQAYVQMQRERIDAIAHVDGVTHAVVLGFGMVDVIRAMAGGDPVKQQLGAEALANWSECTAGRLNRRYGGVR